MSAIPARLRKQSLSLRQDTVAEGEPHLKSRLASYALALAQLAEKVEREEATPNSSQATPVAPVKVPREVVPEMVP